MSDRLYLGFFYVCKPQIVYVVVCGLIQLTESNGTTNIENINVGKYLRSGSKSHTVRESTLVINALRVIIL